MIHAASMSRRLRRLALALCLVPACAAPLLAQTAPAPTAPAATQDATLDSAERILALAVTDNRDAATVRIALKATRDPGVLPLFEKLKSAKDYGLRLEAMLSIVQITKDPKRLDLPLLMEEKSPAKLGAAIAMLIDTKTISDEQLKAILTNEKADPAHRVMAASELSHRKALSDYEILGNLLKLGADTSKYPSNDRHYDVIRHYAAVSLIEGNKQVDESLMALNTMRERHDLGLMQIQELMLLRTFRDKIAGVAPWVKAIAADEKCPPRLRQTAVSTLLALKDPEAPKYLKDLIDARKDNGEQIIMGLLSIQFADQLKPEHLEGLLANKPSSLRKAIAEVAIAAASGKDPIDGLMGLLKDGQPVVLNWAMGYAENAPAERRLKIRLAVIDHASIIDEQRGSDYERAAVAANKIIDEDGPAGRKALAEIIKSSDKNRAASEAALLGILRSTATDASELVAPAFAGLQTSSSTENAANYAALILAREGKTEAASWLGGMIQGGTVQNLGFRALAAWYYAKLKGQSDAVLGRVTPVASKN